MGSQGGGFEGLRYRLVPGNPVDGCRGGEFAFWGTLGDLMEPSLGNRQGAWDYPSRGIDLPLQGLRGGIRSRLGLILAGTKRPSWFGSRVSRLGAEPRAIAIDAAPIRSTGPTEIANLLVPKRSILAGVIKSPNRWRWLAHRG